MSQTRELKDSSLWDRISRATDSVRTLPDWNMGSEKNEREDEVEPEQSRTETSQRVIRCE